MSLMRRPHAARRPATAAHRHALRFGLAAVAIAATFPAHALYKIVGPDGKVTYADRPPAEGANARPVDTAPRAATPGAAALPTGLREPATKFPVTLYTSQDCSPCEDARRFLRQRGVPYSERLVTTNAEGELLNRTTGGAELPAVTIGSQAIRGFAADDWRDYLDAAGYPARSVLPASWRAPAATPLIPPPRVVGPAPAADPGAAAAPAPLPDAPPPDSSENPTGIRF